MTNWLESNPEILAVRTATCDLNGQMRGKRLPAKTAGKLTGSGARMPKSALNVDLWGEDIEDSPLVFESGDADGVLRATERGFMPLIWFDTPSALLPMWMFDDTGAPFAGDPRHALDRIKQRFAKRGWRAVVATELEFYLIDDTATPAQPAASPFTGQPRQGAETLGLRGLDSFHAFFDDLYAACDAMGIAADAASSEAGAGQFEINLMHVDDMMKAADDTWLFQMVTRALARKHGFAASFAAKPFAEQSGTGLHVHFSILDAEGRNIFDDGTERGTDLLRQALAGCLSAMEGSMLILGPHANSYDRFVPGAHAPITPCWGYENRTAALRVPGGPAKARRIEHRVAGGDVNPYLLLAVILGSALDGIEQQAQPPAPITGNAYDQADAGQLPTDWNDAIAAFENSPQIARIFDPLLIDNMLRMKRQEHRKMSALTREDQMAVHLQFL